MKAPNPKISTKMTMEIYFLDNKDRSFSFNIENTRKAFPGLPSVVRMSVEE